MTGQGWDFLGQWFVAQSNGDWEHGEGIEVTTIDNPGWAIRIRIEDTNLQGRMQDWVRWERDELAWLYWRSTGLVFEAACGPAELTRALDTFRGFALAGESADQGAGAGGIAAPAVGTVFGIPASDGRFAVGQIIGRYADGADRLAVYGETVALGDVARSDFGEAVPRQFETTSAPIFVARSYASYLTVGYWPILGWQPVPLGRGSESPIDDDTFADDSRPTVLPWVLEEATAAFHGDQEWQDDRYPELRPVPEPPLSHDA